ncbi:MAG: hypothetical protein JO244_12550, partial [Solirubrobacterales bacterium]|nr:hypothetical protein [Solirubrobacterales bacterium]
DELARLTGTSTKRTRASIARLQKAGLLTWDDAKITFAESPDALNAPNLDGFWAMFRAIPNHRRRVPVPRRVLRFLARGARPALIATILGHLVRCLYVRAGRCQARGRCKTSWIATTFGVDLRRVKEARKELVELGWLLPGRSSQWAMNRWGRVISINLAWDQPRPEPAGGAPGPKLPPPPAPAGPELPPPDSHREPLQDEKNQEPAPGGPAGGYTSRPNVKTPAAEPVVTARSLPNTTPPPPPITPPPIPTRPAPAPSSKPEPPEAHPVSPPTLRHVVPEDLKDTGRLLELHEQAVERGLIGSSENDRLRFVAAAEHARSVGEENPCGLFVHLVREQLWRYLTQSDEDAANARIKEHLYGPPRSRGGGGGSCVMSGVPELSEDARLVREVRAALARAGYRGDPFYAVRSRDASWTRERWDRAVAELAGRSGGAQREPVVPVPASGVLAGLASSVR